MTRPLLALLIVAAPIAAHAGRSERVLGGGWRFHRGDVAGAAEPRFDDRAWSPVAVPHTWNVEDGADGGSQYRGVGWYRLKLEITPAMRRRRLFLRFGAATLAAEIRLNGRKVGEHRGGFGAFALPISPYAREGTNTLAVRVDNARDTDVVPLSGDFTIYGGLTREVKLLALEDGAISPVDDGGPGVYATPRVDGTASAVEVRTVLLPVQDGTDEVRCRTTIEDARGRVVADSDRPADLAPEAASPGVTDGAGVVQRLRVDRPRLWDGVRDPYLYRARVRAIRRGRVIDEVVQPFGFRTVRVDPALGFVLNGRPYDLRGVNLHQGRPSVGWAATRAMQEEDYRLVREMGCTGVRMAHYQHADAEADLCDRAGLVVWAELAAVNQVSGTAAFRENVAAQLRELIKQNYNHPSIAFWSLYNEPWIDRAKGDADWRVMETLAAKARTMDPNRLVTGAMNWGPDHWLTWVGDVAAFNHYWGWYDGKIADWPAQIERIRREAGGRSFAMSEFGAGGSAFQHEVPPRPVVAASRWHPEEYQALFHQEVWPVLAARPWIWGKFLWVMFDFPSDGRNEGDRAGINDKGLVTADRKIRKDAFYYYKAQWSRERVLHIASRRFSPRPAGPAELRVYSNAPRVRARLDGRDLGEMPRVAPGVFLLTNVELAPGAHAVEVAAGDLRDRCRWEAVAPTVS